jgi:hypothetical protein
MYDIIHIPALLKMHLQEPTGWQPNKLTSLISLFQQDLLTNIYWEPTMQKSHAVIY